jgi:hypothetical protein
MIPESCSHTAMKGPEGLAGAHLRSKSHYITCENPEWVPEALVPPVA